MRVVVMGAAGDMGRTAARHLARHEAVTELVLADRDEHGASSLAAAISPMAVGSVSAAGCDVLEEREVRRLLDRADLVLNCAGPFFRLGVPALRAAIDTTTTYIDICDDPEPTIEMLALDDRARAAGVVAVLGMGASPGISNLLALRAANRLDSVHDCFTGWSLDDSTGGDDDSGTSSSDGDPSSAVVHFMEQIHGTVAIVEDGTLVRRPPLEAIVLDFPGLGRGTGYVVGHPEPVTLHRTLGITGRSCNLVLVRDGATAAFLRGIQRDLDDGGLDLGAAARALLRPSSMRLAKAALGGVALRGAGALPPLFACVTGEIGGRAATVGCHVTAMPRGMAGSTSIPAALGAVQLLESLPSPGVHAPEAVIDADRLFADLIPYCTTSVADVEQLAPVRVTFADEHEPRG